MEQFKTIKEDITSEVTEKKSKFIANIYYIENIEEIENKLKELKTIYIGAKHYCYAYRVITNDQVIEKSSDNRRTFTEQQELQF